MSPAARGHSIAVTTGEPAGIGPDICLALAVAGRRRTRWPCRLVLLGDRAVLEARAARLGLDVALPDYDPDRHRNRVELLHVPAAARVRPGRLDPANAAHVLALLDRAVDGCLGGEFGAMVTAPVQKSVINEAGVPFTGHTEYLAGRTGAPLPVMMLVGGGLRVALATTHLPLARVPEALTGATLEAVLRVLDADLRTRFRIARPRILVCGLNPHAGEGGHLGREEIEVIGPTLVRLRRSGLRLEGPLPADTAFLPAQLARADAVLALYHDQGLPVIKTVSFGHAVNVTLGLPIVRTSVDHGTALALAGRGRADPGSLTAAVDLAIRLVPGVRKVRTVRAVPGVRLRR